MSTRPSWRWSTACCRLVSTTFRTLLMKIGSLEMKPVSSVLLCVSFVCAYHQVKFRVCTAQKSWSPSSPLSKMRPRRTASPGRSTITSPSVSLRPSTLPSLRVSHYSFVLVLPGRKFLRAHYKICFPAVYCIMCCKSAAVAVRLRRLPTNQIKRPVIFK